MDTAPFYGTTGIGPDLYAGAQQAVRAMIDHIVGISGLSPEDAYLLASLCVDLKISEIVDAGAVRGQRAAARGGFPAGVGLPAQRRRRPERRDA